MSSDGSGGKPAYDEKALYTTGAEPHMGTMSARTDADMEKDLVARRGSAGGEAAVLYGEIEAERMGYVQRGLKSRHIQFIALGGTIGTGLFLGIGEALYTGGPLAILLGYTIVGIAIYCMMQALGELTTWLPLPGAIPQMCARYFDPAMGFTVGWNQWYAAALTQCSEIAAAATVISFWEQDRAEPINPAAWICIIIVLIFCLNIFAVSFYGEAEFWFAAIKLVTIIGLLLMAFIVDLGGNPHHDRLGFRYWKQDGVMKTLVDTGSTGRFLAFWSTLVNAGFSYGGIEMVAVAAGEAENPRRNIPKAVNRVFYRILFFYVLGTLAVGVLVSSNDERLNLKSGNATASPWVIGIENVGIKVLPHIINAVILTSATSSGNAFLYSGSRYLFALAQNGQAPRFFLRCTKRGVPYFCVSFTVLFSALTFMAAGSGSGVVFSWFINLTTIPNLFTWISICLTCWRFRMHLKAQGVPLSELPMKSTVPQPYGAWFAIIFFSCIIFFNGWQVFTRGNWDAEGFVTGYLGVAVYFLLYVFWKFFKRTKFVNSLEADLWTGKAAIDSEVWPDPRPTTIIGRIWNFIA